LSNPAKILEHKTAGPILSQLGVTDSKNLLIWGGLAMIIVFVLKNIFFIIVEYIKVNYLRNLQIRISRELFYRYMYAEYTYLLSHNTAELLRSCMSDVSRVVLNVVQSFLTLFMNIVLAINLIVVLFVMEPISSLLTVVVIGSVSFIFLRVTRNKLVSLGQRAQEAFLDIIQAVEDGLSGIKETRVMQAESMFINAYNRAFRVFSRSEKIRGLISSAIRPIFEILLVAALLSITAVMFMQNKPIGSIIPMLATFSVAMVRLMPSLREITSVLSTMR
jgi:ABC-type multidrug transport system fused ATPase/permease subunit